MPPNAITPSWKSRDWYAFSGSKFHDYVFSHHFQLATNHKPFFGLIKENSATPTQASARIKRWSLLPSSYEYSLVFRNTTAQASEFQQFLKSNGGQAHDVCSIPPRLADRAVQIVKKGLKKLTTWTMSSQLAKILFNYRISPHTTNGTSPAGDLVNVWNL